MDIQLNNAIRQPVPVNVYRTPDRVVIAAPMPGLRPEDVSVDVTASGRLILQSKPRGMLHDERFDVDVTVDRDGDQQVWTREQWQETKEVVLNEWSTCEYAAGGGRQPGNVRRR